MKLHEQIFLEIKNEKHKYKNLGQLLSELASSLDETKGKITIIKKELDQFIEEKVE